MIIQDDYGELLVPETLEPLYNSSTPLRQALLQRFLRNKLRNTTAKKDIAESEEKLKEMKHRLWVREQDCKEIIDLFRASGNVDLEFLTLLDSL